MAQASMPVTCPSCVSDLPRQNCKVLMTSGLLPRLDFVGEALASISHVAKVTITTKTADSKCGFKTVYCDGKPKGKSMSCAANQGTQIIVEDLFFNIATRSFFTSKCSSVWIEQSIPNLKLILITGEMPWKSGSLEFHHAADVVSKYAIHNAGVAFNLKKLGDQTLYVRTQKESSRKDNIGAIFGHVISKELVDIELTNERLKFNMSGLISNVNFNTKKLNFLLFINNRLVECSALKRAINMVYNAYLPKGSHPFVYMTLEINPGQCGRECSSYQARSSLPTPRGNHWGNSKVLGFQTFEPQTHHGNFLNACFVQYKFNEREINFVGPSFPCLQSEQM